MYGTSENPNRRRSSTNNAVNSRTFNAVLNRNENHRPSNNGRLDSGLLNDLKLNSLNKTKINSILRTSLTSKPNERPFETAKNVSRSQNSGHHQLINNDLLPLNQPDIENAHPASNQPTDQEPFGTNEIDKSRSFL